MQSNTKKRVGILRGGKGENYNSSLRKGGEVIAYILENLGDKYKTIDILIDKDGVWHLGGVPVVPADLVHKVDIIWNVTGPEFSAMLQSLSIPSVGQSFFSGSMENSRDMLREHMQSFGVKMSRSIVLPQYQKDFDGPRERYAIKKAKEVHEKFGSPWIIKSFTPDSSMGIHLAKTFNELVASIEDGVEHEKSILVEEFIAGKPSAVHSIANFRGKDIYILPPDNLTAEEKEKLAGLVKDLHHHLGAEHYLKSDFILHPKRGFFISNIDFSPDLRTGSHLDQSLHSVGAKIQSVIEHILQ